MNQNVSEKRGGERETAGPQPPCYQDRLEPAGWSSWGNTRWTIHRIRFHSLQHRARAPSRTDLQGKLNRWSPYYHFPHLPLQLAIALQFVSSHMRHWGCVFPIATTEVTDCREGFTDPLRFVQSLQFAELSAGRRAGLSQITRCFSSVKAQLPDKFLATWQQQSSMWCSSRTVTGELSNICQKTELGTFLTHWK